MEWHGASETEAEIRGRNGDISRIRIGTQIWIVERRGRWYVLAEEVNSWM
jgi:hypothetical protein